MTSPSPSPSPSPHRVHFHELADSQAPSLWEGQHIQIYGFAHRTQEGEWVLSSSATLRSCCMARSIAHKESIRLTEEPSGIHDGELTLLEGTLHAQATPQKEMTWCLQKPSVIQSQNNTHFFTISLFSACLVILLLIYFLKPILKRFSYI